MISRNISNYYRFINTIHRISKNKRCHERSFDRINISQSSLDPEPYFLIHYDFWSTKTTTLYWLPCDVKSHDCMKSLFFGGSWHWLPRLCLQIPPIFFCDTSRFSNLYLKKTIFRIQPWSKFEAITRSKLISNLHQKSLSLI